MDFILIRDQESNFFSKLPITYIRV